MPVKPDPAFAEAFERLRKARGWSPAEVARRLDVYPTEVSRWRRGLGGISINNVRKIADLFEADRSWLEGLAGYDSVPTDTSQADPRLLSLISCLRGLPETDLAMFERLAHCLSIGQEPGAPVPPINGRAGGPIEAPKRRLKRQSAAPGDELRPHQHVHVIREPQAA